MKTRKRTMFRSISHLVKISKIKMLTWKWSGRKSKQHQKWVRQRGIWEQLNSLNDLSNPILISLNICLNYTHHKSTRISIASRSKSSSKSSLIPSRRLIYTSFNAIVLIFLEKAISQLKLVIAFFKFCLYLASTIWCVIFISLANCSACSLCRNNLLRWSKDFYL